jgi:hypothetical protein
VMWSVFSIQLASLLNLTRDCQPAFRKAKTKIVCV